MIKSYFNSKFHLFALLASFFAGFGLAIPNISFGAICLLAALAFDIISFSKRGDAC